MRRLDAAYRGREVGTSIVGSKSVELEALRAGNWGMGHRAAHGGSTVQGEGQGGDHGFGAKIASQGNWAVRWERSERKRVDEGGEGGYRSTAAPPLRL